MAALQPVYRFWAWLVFAAIILQVGFSGYGAFYVAHKVDKGTVDENKFEDGFGLHAGFGYLVVLLGLILLVLALAGRVRGRRLGMTGLLFGLLIVQVLLAWFGFDVPVIGFFHPINALALFALSGWLATSNRRAAPVERPATVS